ncbi:MAG: isoleucine--tRNA ligase [Anaerolineae bacterium]|nr:isoleucine--tRNA ligase [Anaerolineae bacterium]MDW8173089.1 isoleucine--tRNA ligase [Anaerolineae bacterium]
MFKPVSPSFDVQKLEQEQLEFWRLKRIFQRTTEGREDAPRYVFFEGPPTANGQPGSHHVLARAFKDMFPRYKVMQGYYCERRGGWDTHGLPVEIAVEKELGFTDKRQIEEYGIAAFNEKCRANVFRNINDWEKLTERIGFWVDLDNAYITFTNDYIESVWWILKQLWDKGLIYRGFKTVPYSPSSGTVLSSHEVSLGYKTVKDPSVYVRFPLRDQVGVYFLAWTTTPWTLPANAALAVHPELDYVQVEGPLRHAEGREQLILAESLLDKALTGRQEYTIVRRYKGRDLAGIFYQPLYTFIPTDKKHAYVVTGDFVSAEDGTGIVHIAPSFGQDDFETGQKYDLPMFMTMRPDGRFIDAVDKFKGMWFKDADAEIVRDLKERGLMYRSQKYEHEYPHNWRDGQPLMYMVRDTWFIRTTDYRDKMVALNKTIHWEPEHIRDGRFGNWLEDLKEWALGRERYWGTPLPIWIDEQTGEGLCVGSVEELSRLAGRDLSDLDLHRPYVDEVVFPNPNGGGLMRRVLEVIDVWFDSGAMPLAQWGYPHRNKDKFAEQFPADYICEAVDQTRGWFYSLHAIAVMLFESVAYKNVICLGHILDENGEKMSKSKGNIVDPWMVLNQHGADAFRWYLYTSNPPGESRRFSVDLVGQVIGKFYNTLWNTYSFFVTYANLDGWTPGRQAPPLAERDLLDRWVLSELHKLVQRVTQAFEDYDATGATRPIEAFVESLSDWYVRLSRRRFWKAESDVEKLSAYATLYECLVTVAKLLAPTMPFLSEAMYRNLVVEVAQGKVPESVHLAQWPQVNAEAIDETLSAEMALVQNLVSLGLAARNSANLIVRQPLASVSFAISRSDEREVVLRYADLIRDELNVKDVRVLKEGEATRVRLAPVFAKLGSRLKGDMKLVKAALEEATPEQARAWGQTLMAGQSITLELEGGKSITLAADEVEVRQEAAEGYVVAQEKGYLAALDANLTPELINERLAREVVRRIQTLRKDANFDIADRIAVRYRASEAVAQAVAAFATYIQTETLCDDLQMGEAEDGYHVEDFSGSFKGELNNVELVIGVKRLS